MTAAENPSPQGNPEPKTAPNGSRPTPAWARRLQPIGLLVGAVLGLLAASRGWWQVTSEQADPSSIAGNDATGGLAYVLPLVALAGWLLGLSLRGVGRRIVAVLLALTGAGMVAAGVPRRPPDSVVEKAAGPLGLDPDAAVTATAWPYLFGVAGLLVLLGAIAAFIAAGAATARPSRFDRTSRAAGVSAGDDPSQVWKALDQGVDPTEAEDDSDPEAARRSERPD